MGKVFNIARFFVLGIISVIFILISEEAYIENLFLLVLVVSSFLVVSLLISPY